MADGVTLGISEQCDYHLLEQSSEGAEAPAETGFTANLKGFGTTKAITKTVQGNKPQECSFIA